MFETVFDYGEHDISTIPFDESKKWDFRPDAFSEYRPGFEIRTCRLCKRILLYHHFAELPGGSSLVKSMDCNYFNNEEEGFTFLKEISVTGYTKHDDGSYTQKSLPPFTFEYSKHEWSTEVKRITEEDLLQAPSGLDDPSYQFTDLFSEGLLGILTEQVGAWYYKSNLGEGHFTPATLVSPKPSFNGLSNHLQLVELEANGVKQIVDWQSETKGFFELSPEAEWQPFQTFQEIPNINFSDANTRLLDLNADGKSEVFVTGDEVFYWYESAGKKGFQIAKKVFKQFDEEKGPTALFADKTQCIFLADMSGDGLTDIVRIRNGDVCYWPNLGYGRFGAKVSMDKAPKFDHPDYFDPSFLKLADIDGSGTTDIIYLGKNQFTFWLNQHGNSFLPQAKIIETFPSINNYTQVSVIDLLGTDMACLVWNCTLPMHQREPLRYIDLMSSKKPHIMTGYRNNLGKEVFLEYKPSTKFYLEDKQAGTPWITKLHFPVHCVFKTIAIDRIRKTRFASEYSYHHGYYDHHEREFRGFGRIDQKDSEEIDHFVRQSEGASNSVIERNLHQPPVVTRSWFHTGAFLDQEKILSQFAHEYFQNTAVPDNILPEPVLPDGLSIDEWRQALRVCKGMLLRKEVYASDETAMANKPYAVEQHNCLIKMLQPMANNKYGIFLAHESESITYHYERNPKDPRVAHSFVLEIDKYANVLQNATVVYPRRAPGEDQLTHEPEQEAMPIIFTENGFSNDIQEPLDYRSPLIHFSKSYDVTGIVKPTSYFSRQQLKTACLAAATIDYEMQASAGIQKRLIEFTRSQYCGNDGISLLPFGIMESKGLLHQSSKATFNRNMLADNFSPKIAVAELESILTDNSKGGYVFSNDYFWISSGTQNYDVNHFFISTEFINPFGKISRIEYDDNFMFAQKVIDPLNNEVLVKGFNYRTLSPYLMQDSNDNLSAVRFDELGMVVATFAIGKKGIDAGDEFDDSKTEKKGAADEPGSMLEYSLFEWHNQVQSAGFDIDNYKPKPNVVKTKVRETHYHTDPLHQTKWQESFAFSDGGGQVILKKVQAEPGPVKMVNPDGSVTEVNTSPNLRWVGSGRVILNNKGNPVKQYEPYFSTAPTFDDEKEMVELGVTPVIQYDPLGRGIRTDLPNKTFSKVEFTPWKQVTYDVNDTVLDSGWFAQRINGAKGITEQEAAQKAAVHHATPGTLHLDSLGRSFRTAEHNKFNGKADAVIEEFYHTHIELDVEGNQRKITDARKNIVMEYRYDMLGTAVYQKSMDAGERWMLNNGLGNPLFVWDSRHHRFHSEYDALNRPDKQWLTEDIVQNTSEKLIGFIIYGENQPEDKAHNLRGKLYQSFDQSGRTETPEYDFKGNALSGNKRLAAEYKQMVDWNVADPLILLENETFSSSSAFDALNRPVEMTLPDKSRVVPGYNEAGLLETVSAFLNRTNETVDFVRNIDYDPKGQREQILYGNNTATSYHYEPDTFRLKRLITTRKNGQDHLQDLNYTYDPTGNITDIRDNAQQTIFFNNALVEPHGKYEYDAVYRLIKAGGREHAGQNRAFDQFDRDKTHQGNGNRLTLPGDGNAMQRYEQRYEYDSTGNMLNLIHSAGNGQFQHRWTRAFECNTQNNQLIKTTIGNEVTNYQYDEHGNMLNLQNGSFNLIWNYAGQLKEVNLGGGGIAHYVYDGSGQRVRKVIESEGFIKERIHLVGYEVYRERQGNTINLERETLHIMDSKQRLALIETRTLGNDHGLINLIRYQYSNHLGTACLELDGNNVNSKIISYEEYYPFGNSAYQACSNQTETPKRHRFTSKERDEETGLYYQTARYYVPWLGRWVSSDPAGTIDGPNLYRYVRNNPVLFTDPDGMDPPLQNDTRSQEKRNHSSSLSTTEEAIDEGPPESTSTRKPLTASQWHIMNEDLAMHNLGEDGRFGALASGIAINIVIHGEPPSSIELSGLGQAAKNDMLDAQSMRAWRNKEQFKDTVSDTPAAVPPAPKDAVVVPGQVAASSEFSIWQRLMRQTYRLTGGKLPEAGKSNVSGMAVPFSEHKSTDPILRVLESSNPGTHIGPNGVVLGEMPSRTQFAALTRTHGTEFALVYDPAAQQLRLFQGNNGTVSIGQGNLLAHTHPMPEILPGAYPWAPSKADVDVIRSRNQQSSVIVMSSGEAFRFGP
jgi:RHS repeat-associated protein